MEPSPQSLHRDLQPQKAQSTTEPSSPAVHRRAPCSHLPLSAGQRKKLTMKRNKRKKKKKLKSEEKKPAIPFSASPSSITIASCPVQAAPLRTVEPSHHRCCCRQIPGRTDPSPCSISSYSHASPLPTTTPRRQHSSHEM